MAVVSPMAPASLPALDQDPSDPSADPPACSVDFGSPETLARIRPLSDVGPMTRLLHECIAYHRGLDVRLKALLSQRPDLDRHLLSLHRSSHLLELALSDAGLFLSSVRSTTDHADQVSSKVRELDLTQSRVHSTLSRIDAVVELSHCLDGARRALDAEDFESAARFIQTFFQIDSRFRDSSALDHRDQLLDCKRQLESIVRRRLAAAVDQRDHSSILHFVRIFPSLGLQEEGPPDVRFLSQEGDRTPLPSRVRAPHRARRPAERARFPQSRPGSGQLRWLPHQSLQRHCPRR